MARAFVYIMANYKRGAIYIGVTKDLPRRVFEHKSNIDCSSFTARYDCHRLVWFEDYDDINDAIVDENRYKGWERLWKIEMIETLNPDWRDMCPETGRFL